MRIKSLKTNVWDPVSDKVSKVATIFGLSTSIMAHGKAVANLSNDLSSGNIQQTHLDDYVFASLDPLLTGKQHNV